jgi:hypothetical protein
MHGGDDPDQPGHRQRAQQNHQHVTPSPARTGPEIRIRTPKARLAADPVPVRSESRRRSTPHRGEVPRSDPVTTVPGHRTTEAVSRGHQRGTRSTQNIELPVERADRILRLPVHRPSEKARSKDHRPHQHEDNENHDRQDPLTCLPVMKTLVTDLRHLVDGHKRAAARAVPWVPPS